MAGLGGMIPVACRDFEELLMTYTVETLTPANTPSPIGPYNHIAKAGPFINIGGTAGVDPATGLLAGADAYSQGVTDLPKPGIRLTMNLFAVAGGE
jgi:hypothetical protein